MFCKIYLFFYDVVDLSINEDLIVEEFSSDDLSSEIEVDEEVFIKYYF